MYLFVFCELEQRKILIYKNETCKVMLGNFETGPGPIDPRISWLQVVMVKRLWLHAKYGTSLLVPLPLESV
jgi:hypothetical protein